MSDIIGFSGRLTAVPSREQRAAMLLQVRCSVTDGAFFNIRVRNLSSQGLGGLCLQKVSLREGQSVAISFRNVSPISARVMWFRGNEVGIKFDQLIDLSRITEARTWDGPDFVLNDNHKIADRCYRPGFGNDLK
jgi:predicted DNA-binding antitoxin AbrB/MazE fold protein